MTEEKPCLLNEVETCGDCFLCINELHLCVHYYNPKSRVDLDQLHPECPLRKTPIVICIRGEAPEDFEDIFEQPLKLVKT